jgi:microcystin degradation protein MlrC
LVTTTTTVARQPQDTAVHAINAFVQAWRDGDQAAAATYALPPAVQSAFAAGVPARLTNRGCMSGDVDPISCVYASELGEVQVRATQQDGGWVVDQVQVTPA